MDKCICRTAAIAALSLPTGSPERKMNALLQRLEAMLPVRYSYMVLCAFGVLLALFSLVAFRVGWLALLACAALLAVGVHDLRQTRHAVLRNYPVIGHLRFLLEFIRPELRQYFIESDSEATPFSRAQRSLVYQRAKGEPDKRPFGTQKDVGVVGYEWINLRSRRRRCRRTTFASRSAAAPAVRARSPIRQVCSTSRR